MGSRSLEDIFNDALELDAAALPVFLDQVCAGDAELRAEVESLLAVHRNSADRMPARGATAEEEPRQIGPYPILGELGRGSMGIVYGAEDVRLRRQIAIKLLPEHAAADAELLARFESEARLLAAINHPNIATIHSLEEADGLHFLTMELVPGETLAACLDGGPLSLATTLDICRQIASALEAAHKTGVIHRDLKPLNIKVTAEGEVKILDFGLAKAIAGGPLEQFQGTGESAHDLTARGVIMGSPGYMSPEQVRGEVVDHCADIWAFGCVLFECLTGDRAFGGDTLIEMMAAILERQPDLEALPAETPPAVRQLLGDCLMKESDARLHAIRRARQIIEAEILQSALPGASPPPVTVDLGPGNLPGFVDSFVGRAAEKREVAELLGRHRLLTLTGGGGCGKTRLALEVAGALRGDFADGVWMVELAPLTDPALVPQAVATVLGVKEQPQRPLVDSLVDHLARRNLLLILDNAEHLLEACALLAGTFLRDHPELYLLVTSREALGITGEIVHRVSPLATPADTDRAPLAELACVESVQLFVERARAVHAAFALTGQNIAPVVQVCCRLDGIPLAIELAAARSHVLPPAEIAERLDDRFRLLVGGSRSGLPHHQTLRALIDWSYQQLSEAERRFMLRLAVFAEGFSLHAAEVVAAGDGIEEWEVLDLLSHLVEKSLVELEPERTRSVGEPRYRMLGTIRQFALDRLGESHLEESTARRRHHDHFLALAEEARAYLRGPDQRQWLTRLDADYSNLRAALDHAMEEIGTRTALELAGALGRYWFVRGLWSEGQRTYVELLGRPTREPVHAARASALSWAGVLARCQGDIARARSWHEESVAIRRELGDPLGTAQALNGLGVVMQRQGDFEAAQRCHEESLQIAKELENRLEIAAGYSNLGSIAHRQHDYARARPLYERGLAMQREAGHRQGVAAMLTNLGNVALREEDYDRACSRYEESLEICRELCDPLMVGATLNNLGYAMKMKGNLDQARAIYAEGLAIHRELGDRPGAATTLMNLGSVAYDQGDYEEARSFFTESLETQHAIEAWRGFLESLAFLGMIAGGLGHRRRAVTLLSAARGLQKLLGADLPPGESDWWLQEAEKQRAELGDEEFAQAEAAGQGMDLEQVMACAVAEGEM